MNFTTLILKMETACFCETCQPAHQITPCRIRENYNLNKDYSENIQKSVSRESNWMSRNNGGDT